MRATVLPLLLISVPLAAISGISAGCPASAQLVEAAPVGVEVEVSAQPGAPDSSGEAAVPQVAAPVPAPNTVPVPSAGSSEGEKDPASGMEVRGMMWRLSQTVKGQPVIAVGYGTYRPDVPWSDEEFKRAHSLIEKLQVISAKQSPEDADLIPFRVGNAYVIAPEMREGVNLDLSALSPLDVTARGTLLTDVLLSIPASQLGALGSDQGLAVSSLGADIQAALQRSFRPPLKILEMKPDTYKDENGVEHPSMTSNEAGSLDAPLNWSQVRLRARLRMIGVNVQFGDMGTMLGYGMNTGLMFHEAEQRNVPWSEGGVDLPLFDKVPNTYKPSDLEGRRFRQPFGLSGVWKVGDVVKQLGKVTGLKLSVWKRYQDEPMFIGSPTVTVGEVMDGLRLGLMGSWRRLGDSYLFAFDRLPLQAIQQMARESASAVSRDVRKHRTEMETDPGWIAIARSLPFSPDDPIALSTEQRQRLFSTDPKAPRDTRAFDRSIPFSEMLPDQQDFIREQARKESINLPEQGPDQPAINRPYTDNDLQQAKLTGQANVEISILVPGKGWVRAPDEWNSINLSPWQLERALDKIRGGGPRDILEEAPKEVRDMLENPQPIPMPSSVRAMVVPPLTPARLTVLADEMRRHGFNTLFYPVLFGGYTTFPSKAFPLDPALRGADGLAGAVQAMKPKGIRVVGYFQTLAWQNPEDKLHWLSKYPQWLDVDATGRTRLAWLSSHPDAEQTMDSLGQPIYNYVRASEPMVQTRLRTLLGEVAERRETAGVAFGEWLTANQMPQMGMPQLMSPPPLGYSMPDRLAAFQRTGLDPADKVTYDDYMPASMRDSGEWGNDAPDSKALDPQRVLLDRLLRDAKTLRKDWKTYVVENSGIFPRLQQDDGKPDPLAEAKPDITIKSIFGFSGPSSLGSGAGLLMPVTNRNFFSAMSQIQEMPGSETIPSKLMDMPSIAVYGLFFAELKGHLTQNVPIVLLDFRTAPNLITDSLRLVASPDQKPAAVGPAPAQKTPEAGSRPSIGAR